MRHGMGLRLLLALIAAIFGAACLSEPGHAEGEKRLSSGQTVYVPAYQSIAVSKKPRRLPLTTTLSIRNTDPERQITIVSVKCTNGSVALIRISRSSRNRVSTVCVQNRTVNEQDYGLWTYSAAFWRQTRLASRNLKRHG